MISAPGVPQKSDPSVATVAIIMPAHDEADALPLVLAEIPRNRNPRIVVIDNGSRDGTADVARSHGVEVVQEERPGYGSACQAGLRHLAMDPPDVLVVLDADYSDYPEDLEKILAPILADEVDLVCGSRVELAAPVNQRAARWTKTQAVVWLGSARPAEALRRSPCQ